eukprot:7978182-Pyramimonas_sp.AAC.1
MEAYGIPKDSLAIPCIPRSPKQSLGIRWNPHECEGIPRNPKESSGIPKTPMESSRMLEHV